MPKQMNFVTPDGIEHPESYWKVVYLNLDRLLHDASVTLCGWHNKEAHDAGFQPLNGAKKEYIVQSSAFAQYFNTSELDPKNRNPYAQAYLLAENIQDVVTGYEEDGSPIMVGFFDDALTVDV